MDAIHQKDAIFDTAMLDVAFLDVAILDIAILDVAIFDLLKMIFFLTFRRRLPVRGSGSCRDLSIFLRQWPIPPWCSRLSGPFWPYRSTATLVFL